MKVAQITQAPVPKTEATPGFDRIPPGDDTVTHTVTGPDDYKNESTNPKADFTHYLNSGISDKRDVQKIGFDGGSAGGSVSLTEKEIEYKLVKDPDDPDDDETKKTTGREGSTSRGTVTIHWRNDDEWVGKLDDQEKAAWLDRYLVIVYTQETSLTNPQSEPEKVIEKVEPLNQMIGSTIDLSPGTAEKGKSKAKEVRIVPVEIKWEKFDADYPSLEDNINPFTKKPEGQRIFPGKKDPTDTIRNKVKLKVHVGTPDTEVFVKAFDVDDPTPKEKDSDFKIDPNDKTGEGNGDDNRADQLNTPKTGIFLLSNSDRAHQKTDKDGKVDFDFQVGMQPGNNYRVAVSIKNENDYSKAQVTSPDKDGYLGPSKLGQGILASPLLTVWRKLHIENDSMDAIPAVRPVPDSVTGLKVIKIDTTTNEVITGTGGLSSDNTFYDGGYLAKDGKFSKVLSYRRSLFGTKAYFRVKPADIGSFAVDDEISVFDDDDAKLPAQFTIPQPAGEQWPRLKLPKNDLINSKITEAGKRGQTGYRKQKIEYQ